MLAPLYLDLHRTGRLAARLAAAKAMLKECQLCPRACGVDRTADQRGVCGVGREALVAHAGPHFGEERCLVGSANTGLSARPGGSGTVFFAGCGLRCVFCQNWRLSLNREGSPVSPAELAQEMLRLQRLGCHNINLVTPSHVVPQLLQALPLAIESGLRLPLIYNTSGYDAVETLRLLEGIIDVYMPDFKYWDEAASMRDLRASDYPERAREAIAEMHRQVGDLAIDDDGIARHGLLVRHLVMPGARGDAQRVFRWLAMLSPSTFVNVMGQYRPEAGAPSASLAPPDLSRPLRSAELRVALDDARAAGLRRAACW